MKEIGKIPKSKRRKFVKPDISIIEMIPCAILSISDDEKSSKLLGKVKSMGTDDDSDWDPLIGWGD